jgi:hypothetical protein
MSTIQQWLDEAGFNWERGLIVVHTYADGAPAARDSYSRWDTNHDKVAVRRRAHRGDPVLVHEFDSGFGSPACPRFFAKDDQRIYFPVCYDGATWCEAVHYRIGHYLEDGSETPYCGGG